MDTNPKSAPPQIGAALMRLREQACVLAHTDDAQLRLVVAGEMDAHILTVLESVCTLLATHVDALVAAHPASQGHAGNVPGDFSAQIGKHHVERP